MGSRFEDRLRRLEQSGSGQRMISAAELTDVRRALYRKLGLDPSDAELVTRPLSIRSLAKSNVAQKLRDLLDKHESQQTEETNQ
jgi:hypothetical protein